MYPMGIRMDDPDIEAGTDCGYCTGDPPLVWPAGGTPETVYVTFHNLAHCPGYSMILPNGRSFALQQDPAFPCRWVHDGDIWFCTFYAWTVSNYSEVLLGYNPATKYAFQGINPICPFEFLGYDSLFETCSANICCTGGIAVVSWGDLPRDLMDDMGIEFSDETFHEVMPQAVDQVHHRFARRLDSTRVYIRT
jgi:hypothetical protein